MTRIPSRWYSTMEKKFETGCRNVVLLLATLRTAEVPFNARIRTQSCRANREEFLESYIHLRSKRKKKAKRDKALDTLDSFTCCIVRQQDKDRLAKRDAFNENLVNFSGFYGQWITHCEILHVANSVMFARCAIVKAINILWFSSCYFILTNDISLSQLLCQLNRIILKIIIILN